MGFFPGRFVLRCLIATEKWKSPRHIAVALFSKEPLPEMKDCRARVENPFTRRVKEGRCDGTFEVSGVWVEQRPSLLDQKPSSPEPAGLP